MSAFTFPRTESYRVDVLDAEDRPVGALDGLVSGRMEQNVYATIRGGLGLRFMGAALAWGSVRLRPVLTVNGEEVPLGVYLPASPKASHGMGRLGWDVSAWDKTIILSEDRVPETFTIAEGALITDVMRDVILGAGETSIAIEPSALTAPSMRLWEPGTPRLRILNDLAETINYFSVWCDGRGQYRLEPYRAPSYRPTAFSFEEGDLAIHQAPFTREQDTAGVPNRVILMTTGDEETAPLISVAENTDPASPYSFQARGDRWVTAEPRQVEAASQAVLDALTERALLSLSSPSITLDVRHAPIPIAPNDAVRFVSDGIDVRAVVESFSLDLSPGSLISAKWREVTS